MHELGPACPAENLRRAVGDDLVGVGVGGSSRTGLVDVDRELVVEFSVDDLLRRLDDRAHPALGKKAELAVGLRGGLLDQSERADEPARKWLAGDREVEDGPLRRRSVVGAGGDLHLAHRVFFDSRLLCCHRRDCKFCSECAWPPSISEATRCTCWSPTSSATGWKRSPITSRCPSSERGWLAPGRSAARGGSRSARRGRS